jgi:hypothetical protein
MSGPRADARARHTPPTPLHAVLALTFLASIGTGLIWNGIFFIAEHDYGYSQRQSLMLSLVLGAGYLAGAAAAASVLRRVDRWLSPRRVLLCLMLVQAAVCVSPLLWRGAWVLWLLTIVNTLASSFFWPIVESYLTAGRHGAVMRRGIGYWNVVWMSAVALSLLLLAPLIKEHSRSALVGLGGLTAVAAVTLAWFKPWPGSHDSAEHAASVGPEYPWLLRAARVLLPLSYVLSAAMVPLLPYRLGDLGVAVEWKTPVTATWLLTRVVAAAVMWRMAFWHGRWGTLLAGGVLMLGGFAAVVAGPSLGPVFAGFTAFGAGMGMIYYAALYYAMAVGRAEVGAGGVHEALIGAGYTAGPLAALAGIELGPRLGLDPGEGIVILAGGVAILVAWRAAAHYARARARRGAGGLRA